MAIKNINRRLVEIGKVKIGGKNPNKTYIGKDQMEHRAPVKYDHFVVTDLDKDQKDNFIPNAEIMKELGSKPKALEILLLSDDIDKNFLTSYQFYRGQKCVCRGDGETASRRFELDKDQKPLPEPEYKIVPCDTEKCPFFLSKKCKPSGMLSFMLPQTKKVGGVYKFRTHSWNSIVNILSSLEAIKIISGGVLYGIPLLMELIEKNTEDHGKVKVVNIVYNGDIPKLQLEATRQKQLRLDGSVSMESQNKLLSNSDILTDTDDPKDIQDEFYEVEEDPSPGASAEKVSSELKNKSEKQKIQKVNKDEQEEDLPIF